MIKVNHPSGVKFTVPDEWVRRGVEITVNGEKVNIGVSDRKQQLQLVHDAYTKLFDAYMKLSSARALAHGGYRYSRLNALCQDVHALYMELKRPC